MKGTAKWRAEQKELHGSVVHRFTLGSIYFSSCSKCFKKGITTFRMTFCGTK